MPLKQFFERNRKCALAFSGGTDSAYLLYAGLKYGADIVAFFVKTAFQPSFELKRAERMAKQLGAKFTLLEADILQNKAICQNAASRCYDCKKYIFGIIYRAAVQNGYSLLIDGTNASDSFDERPGMKVLAEMGVRSPLREAGLKKEEIRTLSKEAGLATWNLPSYSCLATRITQGVQIKADLLASVEAAEMVLEKLGYSDFRVRTDGKSALVQIIKDELPRALMNRDEILKAVRKYFDESGIDSEGR